MIHELQEAALGPLYTYEALLYAWGDLQRHKAYQKFIEGYYMLHGTWSLPSTSSDIVIRLGYYGQMQFVSTKMMSLTHSREVPAIA
jgi:hypothetical protein